MQKTFLTEKKSSKPPVLQTPDSKTGGFVLINLTFRRYMKAIVKEN